MELIKGNNHIHPFHLVDPSPWPFIASWGAFFTTCGGVLYMHQYKSGYFLFVGGLLVVSLVSYTWWRDVVREATFEGQHTEAVQKGLRLGMVLFITSEVMFFVAFFWAFFHSSLAPTFNIGGVWPPANLEVLSPWEIPLLNTILLLSSGATLTWCHYAIVVGSKKEAVFSLVLTIVLAAIFTGFQGWEYVSAPFSICDSIYGSTFYLLTGFHGFHVIIGTTFLAVCLYRLYRNHFTTYHHVGFEAAAWYWHFVDVVWLFLFIVVYWWGGN